MSSEFTILFKSKSSERSTTKGMSCMVYWPLLRACRVLQVAVRFGWYVEILVHRGITLNVHLPYGDVGVKCCSWILRDSNATKTYVCFRWAIRTSNTQIEGQINPCTITVHKMVYWRPAYKYWPISHRRLWCGAQLTTVGDHGTRRLSPAGFKILITSQEKNHEQLRYVCKFTTDCRYCRD